MRAGVLVTSIVVVWAAGLARGQPPGFVEVRSDDVKWRPHPSVTGAQVAVLVGAPNQEGPLVLRVKLPANTRIMPHTHPDARTYTVLEGEWRLGFGAQFDPAQLRTYPAGSMYRLPAKVPHFQATGAGTAVVQIESIGPTSTDFLNPAHDPRKAPR